MSTPLDCSVDDRYATVTLQPGLIFAHDSQPYSGVEIVQVVIDWPQSLDPAAMRDAWQNAAARHPALRTAFVWPDGAEPVQEVRSSVVLPVTVLDWSGGPTGTGTGTDNGQDAGSGEGDGRERTLDRFLLDDRCRGFDARTAPLARVTLIRHGVDRHTLVFTMHHAILDGRSVHMLLDEVVAEHDAIRAGRPYLAPPRPAYRDFVSWLDGRPLSDDRRFWAGRFDGLSVPTPLDLAPVGDQPRTTRSIREVARALSPEQTALLSAAARSAGVPMSTIVAATWALVLSHQAGTRDVVFGAVRSCRRGSAPGAERMIGLLINTVPVSVRVDPHKPLRQWLADVRREIEQLRPHQVAGLPMIQRWSGLPANTPIFESLLMYDHRDLQAALTESVADWGGRTARLVRHPDPPLTLCVFGAPTVRAQLYHDQRRMPDDRADALLGLLHTLLTGMATNLDRPVGRLPLLDPASHSLVTSGWAGRHEPAVVDDAGPTVTDMVERQVRRQPDAPAVVAPDGTLTYRELDERANRLAHLLVARGVRPDEPVAVTVARGTHLIVALLAVLKAGGAYLALDPADPPARLAGLLADAGDPLVVTAGELPVAARTLRLDRIGSELAAAPAQAPTVPRHPLALAYLSYTSGSTGRPKGVAVAHRAVVRLVHQPGYLRLGPAETVLHLAPVAFDAATLEIWGSLATGARLAVAPPGPIGITELGELLRRERVSVAWLTAGLFHQVAEFAPDSLAGVGQLLAGGDVLYPEAIRRVLRLRGGPLVNGYGPTENTTFTCVHVMTDPAAVPDPVPIGRPVPQTTVYVLDDGLRPVPVGVPGELYAGGAGVARGYLGRPGATAAVFLPDPFDPTPGARMYRTGDRVRWRADGTLDFLGRVDGQVKIRGFRVEPGEVAGVLREHPTVGDAVVVVDGTGEQRRLVAYVTPRPGAADPATADLARYAEQRLPVHLRPAACVVLPALPLNRNGKVDRAALPSPEAGSSARAGAAPTERTEIELAGIWYDLLGNRPASVEDDFFLLGGNSLLATRLRFAVADRFGVDLPVQTIYRLPVLRALAEAVRQRLDRPAADGPAIRPRDRAAYRADAGSTAIQPRDRAAYRVDAGGAAAPGAPGAVPGTDPPPGGHLLRPDDGPWGLWRWVGLRAAGFPVATLADLGDPELVAAADRVLDREEELEAVRGDLLGLLRAGRAANPDDQRAEWNRAIRHLLRDGPPRPLPTTIAQPGSAGGDGLAPAHRRVVEAYDEVRAAREAYPEVAARAARRRSAALRAVAADPLFREAVLWQNRHALRTGVDALLTANGSTGSKHRQHETLVATYLQRYCVKNDTIGFFGPVGWVTLSEATPTVTVSHGATPLAARTVYFENWAVERVAEALADRDPRLRPWLVPRRMPFLSVDDAGRLVLPLTPPVPLPAPVSRVLAACDGIRPAADLAADLVADPGSGLSTVEDVYRVLEQLRDAGRVTWSFEVPKEDLFPERAVRARLAAVPDPAVRAPALAAFDELERARSAVAVAAGDPPRLDAALDELENAFTALTGSPPTRRAGRVYAGRTLVFEDCRSSTQVTLPADLTATLWPVLNLVLDSARWFTFAGAALFRRLCQQRHAELAQRHGTAAVPFADFWMWTHDLLFDLPEKLIAPVTRGLQDRWARILPAAVDHRITATAEQLRDRVAAEFAAPRPGWMGAHQHSPDVMLAAEGLSAIERGDYLWVLGEVHPGVNTLRSALFVGQHPDPARLLDAMTADLPGPRVAPAATGDGGGAPSRLTDKLLTDRDLRLVFGHDACGLDPATAVSVADCVVEPVAGVLTVRSRDGRHAVALSEMVAEPLMLQIVQRFDIVRPAQHQPRVTVDRVVLARESWRLRAADLDFADVADEGERFHRVRRWQRANRLPRHLFVRTPVEKKPFHLDLASLAAVDLFARSVRRTVRAHGPEATLRLSEMLPGPDQTWLTDAQGRTRTAELRLVAVDTRKTPEAAPRRAGERSHP